MATGNALLVRVKDNQPTLHAALAGLCAAGRPFDSHETVDRGRHGRQEHRHVEVFDTAGLLDAPWQALVSCVARVSRLTYLKNTRTGLWATREEVGYYPCQARHDAKVLGGAIRAHWGIENDQACCLSKFTVGEQRVCADRQGCDGRGVGTHEPDGPRRH